MEFEWDKNKNISNTKKHGITFNEAQSIFDDLYSIILEDNRFDYEERRFLLVGKLYLEILSKDILAVVIYTEREGIIRIISARKANKRERKLYESKRFF